MKTSKDYLIENNRTLYETLESLGILGEVCEAMDNYAIEVASELHHSTQDQRGQGFDPPEDFDED